MNLLELSDVIRITVIGLLAGGVGTGSGSLVTFFTRNPAPRFLSMSLGFAAGMMLEVSFLELIPEAIAQGNFFSGSAGLIGGIITLLLLDNILPHYHHYSKETRQGRFRKMGNPAGYRYCLCLLYTSRCV